MQKVISSELYEYFSTDPDDPADKIHEVSINDRHPFHDHLMAAVNKIDSSIIEEVKEDKLFQQLGMGGNNPLDVNTRAGIWYLINFLQDKIAGHKLELLKNQEKHSRPKPYDHPAISDLQFDDNYLVPLNQFIVEDSGLARNGYVFTISPVIKASNSSYWLSNFFAHENLYNKMLIRLDPLMCRPKEIFRASMYKMWVWGKPLNWKEIHNLKEPLHGQWLSEDNNNGINVTQFAWIPSDGEVHFTCEEIPKEEFIHVRGSRYLHAICDKKVKAFSHLDGAIRIFSETELAARLHIHIRSSEAIKVGKRIKIFQINDVSVDLFSGLASAFFVWNDDVINYFRGATR
ncbi:MAG: hypothetical protein ACLP29_08855 [Dissulfurispiraceae bacterium]